MVALEAEIQVLRERQKKERPLPARLQAATHRLEKAKAARTEAAELVTDLEEKLVAAKVGLDEAESKLLEAEQELQAVKQQVADGQATVMAASFQHALLQRMARSSPMVCGPCAYSSTARWWRLVVRECRL